MKTFVILTDQDPNRLTKRINEHASNNWTLVGSISVAICGMGILHEHGTTKNDIEYTVIMSKLTP